MSSVLSGRYWCRAGDFFVELRLDVDGPQPLHLVSGDVAYLRNGRWQIGAFGPAPSAVARIAHDLVSVTARGPAAASLGGRITLTLEIDVAGPVPRPRGGEIWAPKLGATTLVAGFSGRALRHAKIVHFTEPTFPFSDLVADTHVNADRPPSLPRRRLSLEEAYSDAGIGISRQILPLRTTPALSGLENRWSDAELYAAMSRLAASISKPAWQLVLFTLAAHENPSTIGVMFDGFDANQRQGCAVFAHNEYTSGNDLGQWARAMLWAVVHEVGHCFNLTHSFEAPPGRKTRPLALTWMNYPFAYDRIAGSAGAFWRAFPFAFDTHDLMWLRHGPNLSVVMGGTPFGEVDRPAPRSQARFSWRRAAIRPDDQIDSAAARPAGPRLRLESRPEIELGEPVFIEVKLSPPSPPSPDLAWPTSEDLDPSRRRLQLSIEGPDGRSTVFRPFVHHSVVLSDRRRELEAIYHSFQVSLDAGGFNFKRPGQYRLWARFLLDADTVVESAAIALRVVAPRGLERVAELSLLPEVGLCFAFETARVASHGQALLEQIVQAGPDRPHAAHAKRILGLTDARGFKVLDPARQSVDKLAPNPNMGVARLLEAIGPLGRPEATQFDNITLRMTGEVCLKKLGLLGRDADQDRLRDKLERFYVMKEVKPQIRWRISHQLLGACMSTRGDRGAD